MRKVFFIIAVSVLFLLGAGFTKTTYNVESTVVFVQRPCDLFPEGYVVCKINDNRFITFLESDDWLEGDIALLTINDNGSPFKLDDDYVTKALYNGYIY